MIADFKGPYPYTKAILLDWNDDSNGVYYIGTKTSDGALAVNYVGKGTGEGGMRARLLVHLDRRWLSATHFGFHRGTTILEIENFEIAEIKRLNPTYNIHHT